MLPENHLDRRPFLTRVGFASLIQAASIQAALLLLVLLFSHCAVPAGIVERQGLYGTFTTYHLPPPEPCLENFTTQEQRDACKERNQTRIIQPIASNIVITSVDDEYGRRVALDSSGSYRQPLKPGYYTVCLGKSCSDALEVRMNTFVSFGAQYPLASLEAILKGNPDSTVQVEAAAP